MFSTDDQDFSLEPTSLAFWALNQKIWDGQKVEKNSQEKLAKACFDQLLSSIANFKTATIELEKIALVGATIAIHPEGRRNLFQDMGPVDLNFNGWQVKNVSWGDDLKEFWEDHKVEILIGAATIAIITAVAIVTISSGGAAAGVATAAGSAIAAIDESLSSSENLKNTVDDYTSTKNDSDFSQQWKSFSDSKGPISHNFSEGGNISFFKDFQRENSFNFEPQNKFSNNWTNQSPYFQDFSFSKVPSSPSYCFNYNQNISLPKSIPSLPTQQSSVFSPVETISKPNITENFFNKLPDKNFLFEKTIPVYNLQNLPQQITWYDLMKSSLGTWASRDIPKTPYQFQKTQLNHCLTFTTNKNQSKRFWIGGINGINTNLLEAIDHAQYLDKLAGEPGINWVYNHTNGATIDVLEAGFANLMLRYSPETASLLRKNWEEFHEATKDTPEVKYLQFCHSQGAAHTKNALAFLPEEIAKRIFIVAIAPLTVIPSHLCGGSINIASPLDKVPKIEKEFIFHTIRDLHILQMALERLEKERKELILLEPINPQSKWDHEFQSDTYAKVIQEITRQYIENNGEISKNFDFDFLKLNSEQPEESIPKIPD